MRRPLNWIVVAISLLMLVVNRMAVGPGPSASIPATSESLGLFAYVQEDGTLLFLPVPESAVLPPLSFEEVHARSVFEHGDAADPKAAVYTWTSPGP
jgi:hypothetical protein